VKNIAMGCFKLFWRQPDLKKLKFALNFGKKVYTNLISKRIL
jgi:hypothetical protein